LDPLAGPLSALLASRRHSAIERASPQRDTGRSQNEAGQAQRTLCPRLQDILKNWEEERAREHQRYEAERKRRAELQRVAEENEKRQAKLAELAGNWQTAQTMRAFIEAVKAVPHDANATIADRSIADWLTWAEAAADSLDVSGGGPERLFEVLARSRRRGQPGLSDAKPAR
jgi:hypothetical protein